MTIDERIQALTESLELLSGIVQENARENTRQIEQNARQIEQLSKVVAQDAENTRALARIADMHDRRITRIEDEGR